MTSIGYVRKTENNEFVGVLHTMTFKIGLTIKPNSAKTGGRQPDYLVYAENGFQLGGAWIKTGKKGEYLSLAMVAPELGKDVLYANLSKSSTSNDDKLAILWNPSSARSHKEV